MQYEINRKMLGEQPQEAVALQRLTVEIEYLDGTTEKLEATGKLDLGTNPAFIIITTSRGEGIGIAVSAIKRWSAKASKLSVVGN